MPEKLCFVIAPIGEGESETRKRSDQILKHVISPAVAECGYKALRADKIAESGMITGQIIQHILDDPLVIADLTDRNPNVFYELALRHAIRKPFIQIIREGEPIPFDVAGLRTIPLDHHDLDSVEQAKVEITAQIKSIENDPKKLVTPISVTLDLQALRQSDNPEQRSLGEVLSGLAQVQASISALDKRVEIIASTRAVDNLRREIVHFDPSPSARYLDNIETLRKLMNESDDIRRIENLNLSEGTFRNYVDQLVMEEKEKPPKQKK